MACSCERWRRALSKTWQWAVAFVERRRVLSQICCEVRIGLHFELDDASHVAIGAWTGLRPWFIQSSFKNKQVRCRKWTYWLLNFLSCVRSDFYGLVALAACVCLMRLIAWDPYCFSKIRARPSKKTIWGIRGRNDVIAKRAILKLNDLLPARSSGQRQKDGENGRIV